MDEANVRKNSLIYKYQTLFTVGKQVHCWLSVRNLIWPRVSELRTEYWESWHQPHSAIQNTHDEHMWPKPNRMTDDVFHLPRKSELRTGKGVTLELPAFQFTSRKTRWMPSVLLIKNLEEFLKKEELIRICAAADYKQLVCAVVCPYKEATHKHNLQTWLN